MNHGFFIAGTDTGVGKTFVATMLLQLAQRRGLTTLGLKPVSAGCEMRAGQLVNVDAWELMKASTTQPTYDKVNPVALREAMAPHIAAEREGRVLRAAPLAEHCREMMVTADFTVIEGAGGWRVPLNDSETMADLAAAIGCPILLIVGMRLGCINHALLSAEAIQSTGLRLAGWVANILDTDMAVPDENIMALEQRLHAPRIGTLPWNPKWNASSDPAGERASDLDLDTLLSP